MCTWIAKGVFSWRNLLKSLFRIKTAYLLVFYPKPPIILVTTPSPTCCLGSVLPTLSKLTSNDEQVILANWTFHLGCKVMVKKLRLGKNSPKWLIYHTFWVCGNNCWTWNPKKLIKDSKDWDSTLVSNKSLREILRSCVWGPGPNNFGLKPSSLMTSPRKTWNPILKILFIANYNTCRVLSVSNSSLAQSTGQLGVVTWFENSCAEGVSLLTLWKFISLAVILNKLAYKGVKHDCRLKISLRSDLASKIGQRKENWSFLQKLM